VVVLKSGGDLDAETGLAFGTRVAEAMTITPSSNSLSLFLAIASASSRS